MIIFEYIICTGHGELVEMMILVGHACMDSFLPIHKIQVWGNESEP